MPTKYLRILEKQRMYPLSFSLLTVLIIHLNRATRYRYVCNYTVIMSKEELKNLYFSAIIKLVISPRRFRSRTQRNLQYIH